MKHTHTIYIVIFDGDHWVFTDQEKADFHCRDIIHDLWINHTEEPFPADHWEAYDELLCTPAAQHVELTPHELEFEK